MESDHDDDDNSIASDSSLDDIRNDLAETPFEDILQMRDKLGTRIYRDSVLNKLGNLNSAKANDEDDDDESSPDQIAEISSSSPLKEKKRKVKGNPNLQFKRVNKSFPIEATNKRVDYRHNFAAMPTISGTSTRKQHQLGVPGGTSKQSEFRDPRFESRAGDFQSDKFEQNYRFLNDLKQKELETLRKKLRKTKSEEAKAKLAKSVQILQNQILTEQKKEQSKQVEKKIRAKVKDFKESDRPLVPKNNKDKIPVNKSTMKRAQLVEKYKQLKQTGKLDKYIEKKRKKNLGKDKKVFFKPV